MDLAREALQKAELAFEKALNETLDRYPAALANQLSKEIYAEARMPTNGGRRKKAQMLACFAAWLFVDEIILNAGYWWGW